MSNLFEIATRNRYRFDTTKGQLSVEDLWSLPLTARQGGVSLDSIAIDIHRQLQALGTVSFVSDNVSDGRVTELNNQLEIVKHVIQYKKAEIQAKTDRVAREERREQIQAILQDKKDAALRDLPVEELERLLKDQA